jgi:CspA family cold shock protein
MCRGAIRRADLRAHATVATAVAKAHMSGVKAFGSACSLLLAMAPGATDGQCIRSLSNVLARRAMSVRRISPFEGMTTMTTGVVKWFNATKGYGFIQPEDGAADVFVHISDVERSGLGSLKDGQRVSFEIMRGKNGKNSATNLKAA